MTALQCNMNVFVSFTLISQQNAYILWHVLDMQQEKKNKYKTKKKQKNKKTKNQKTQNLHT